MADDKKDSPKSPSATETSNVKRPYATLDLKATEIKVTSIAEKSSQAADAARLAAAAAAGKDTKVSGVPRPAAASTYAEAAGAAKTANGGSANSGATKVESKPAAAAAATPKDDMKSAPKVPSTPTTAAPEKVIVKSRGGIFSHIAAGIIGGALALSASEWALPQLGIHGTTSRLADDTAALGQRLQNLEKATSKISPSEEAAVASRLGALEAASKEITALKESQSRLVAETKAALAAAASDSGAPEFIERLAKVESQMKSMADAGANDPNAGRLPQLAALTGKVADLETSLQTQLTALRKSVSGDVEARMAAATEASEAAKSGVQRIDRDVAGLKSESVRLAEHQQAMKLDGDRVADIVKSIQDESRSLKATLEAVKSEAAKPADVAAALAPVTQNLASLQKTVDGVIKAEEDRRTNAGRVLLSLELQNLKRVIERGQKYGPELAEVEKAADAKIDLAPLRKFKDTGVPTLADLGKEFRSVANNVIDADSEPVEGGVVDRLLAGAKSVVRVRKVVHEAGDRSTEAVVGRMEMALNDGKLSDVISAAKDLSSKAAEAARPFLDKVDAKVSVDTAVATLETQLKSSLSGGSDAASKATQ